MIGGIVTGVTGLLFPMFASYRALLSNDISLIRPWLMYWIVFATFQFAEGMFHSILSLVPFYGFMKSGFMLWLVLPQTQGAIQLYTSKLEPWLRSHNQQIDEIINTTLGFINSTPLSPLLKMLIPSLKKRNGPPPSGTGLGTSNSTANGGGYLDSILGSFRQTSNPDANLSAYLPALLGGGSSAAVRNRLLGLVKSLDTNSTSNSRSPESESFDYVEMPRGTASATEIEREIKQKINY